MQDTVNCLIGDSVWMVVIYGRNSQAIWLLLEGRCRVEHLYRDAFFQPFQSSFLVKFLEFLERALNYIM